MVRRCAIHNLEASQDFTEHLHNGDPLTHRTVQVPADRPKAGHPPFTWDVSASDALTMHGFDAIAEWTVPTMLFQFEKYNGFGYRNGHPEVLSPYLWCFTNHYTKGKFVKDGVFSSTTRSQQCGAVALLLRLHERKAIAIGGTVRAMAGHGPVPLARTAPHQGAPPFPGVALARGVAKGDDVCRIQTRLRQLGFTIGVVTGCPFGPQTEAAVIAFQTTLPSAFWSSTIASTRTAPRARKRLSAARTRCPPVRGLGVQPPEVEDLLDVLGPCGADHEGSAVT